MKIAIVGGGPGGLLSAHFLRLSAEGQCEVTLFEASDRVGGKMLTVRFECAPVVYEAGLAELYDYSHIGPDPLRALVAQLGLETVTIEGPSVILGDKVIRSNADLEELFGKATADAVKDFHAACRSLMTPAAYYEGHGEDDNAHPWADKTWAKVLDEIPDETARLYVHVASRSDIATDPSLTNALDGAKNVLMDDPDYITYYSIVGGNERLIEALRRTLDVDLRLNHRVVSVQVLEDSRFRLSVDAMGRTEAHDFDLVILAAPDYWLNQIAWKGRDLRVAMEAHLAHYAYPAHYLRVSLLFESPFWRDHVSGAFFMSDAFGGSCLYDEGTRHDCGLRGVLNWLIAGSDAMTLANETDDVIVRRALAALPAPLALHRSGLMEAKVHRWIGTISGLPGGNPVHGLARRHQPDAVRFPGLLNVGDYLFDSTLNGTLDSADFATDLVLTQLRKKRYAAMAPQTQSGSIDPGYHERYAFGETYADSFEDLFNAQYTVDLIHAVWDVRPPYRLLDTGSASGLTLGQFSRLGIDAWGVENSAFIHAQTPLELRERNLLGDVRRLPFPDASFDFIYDTALPYLPEEDVDAAIAEMFRVCRIGVLMGGVTTDMTDEVIEDYELMNGVRCAKTLWEWSESFVRNGFRLAVTRSETLDAIWKVEQETDEDDWNWYRDKGSMRYCFYKRP